MTKAIVFSGYGGPDALHMIEIDEPQAGIGQVRVRVRAAGVQSFECKLRRGELAGWVAVTFPQRLGNEFAGVVDQVGQGVRAFAVGDQVLGFTTLEAYSEAVVVGVEQLVAKPASMSWEVAGALSAAGQTAYHALKGLGVGEGDTVLIHAAAGGVGTVAVQLAREWGARVIGTASEGNHDYLRSLGAIPVAYGDGLAERVQALAPEGVDAALDAVGGDSITASLELIEDKRRIGTIVDYAAAGKFGIRILSGERSAGILGELADLHTQGKLRIHIHQAFPLDAAADAHREVETRHVHGRVVLTVD